MKLEILLSVIIGLILIGIGISVLLWRKGAKALKEEREKEQKKREEEAEKLFQEGHRLFEEQQKNLENIRVLINEAFKGFQVSAEEAERKISELILLIAEYEKGNKVYREEKEDELAQFTFEPYYVYLDKEIETDTGEKLKENSFHLIVFEKDGKGELFSGQGWIDLENVIKNPTWAGLPKPWTLGEEVELKNGPSKGYHTIKNLKRGTLVQIEDYFGAWARVRVGKEVGYICIEEIK